MVGARRAPLGRKSASKDHGWVQLAFDAPRSTLTYDRGLHVEGIDLWLDPHTRRPAAYISHGHSDHCRPHGHIFATPPTADFYRLRTGRAGVTEIPMGVRYPMGSHDLELFPAGHVLGSSQARVRDVATGRDVVYTGDFKLRASRTLPTAPVLACDTLVMECTYGAPRYIFPDTAEIVAELITWIRSTLSVGSIPIVCGYALGKAQEAMAVVNHAGFAVAIHPSIAPYADIYRAHGVDFGTYTVLPTGPGWFDDVPTETVVICPPHLVKSIPTPSARYSVMMLTGWAVDRRFSGTPQTSLPLSDHAGFNDLVAYVEQARPRIVYTVHGTGGFAQYLRRQGIEAIHLGQ